MNRRDALKGIFAAAIAASLAPLPTAARAASTITVSMLLRASFGAVAASLDRAYILGEIVQLPTNHAYITHLTDPASGKSVPLAWSAIDERGDVINLTASLLESGFDLLDMIVSGEIGG